MAKEVRLCGECGREKPYYRPTFFVISGYGPHCYDRADYCIYCLKETDTIIKTQTQEPRRIKVFNSPKPIIEPDNNTSTRAKNKSQHKSKAAATDKYAAKFNIYSKKHDSKNEARQQKGQSAKLSQFKKIKCLYCDKLFKTESGCTQHIRDVHPNAKTANEYHGIAEKAEKADEYPKIFNCGYCGMKCTSQKLLEEHVISWKHL